jgi:predicted DNA-binding transcriptional regulator AlpA
MFPMSTAPLVGARLLKADEVMVLTGHRDRSAFWQWVRRNGVPFLRLGPKSLRFEEAALRAWLDSRSVGQKRRAA